MTSARTDQAERPTNYRRDTDERSPTSQVQQISAGSHHHIGFSATFSASPALVAQGIEHWFPKPCAAGSNPAEGTGRTRGDQYREGSRS